MRHVSRCMALFRGGGFWWEKWARGGSMPGMNNRETDYRVYGFAHACPYAQRVARDPCPNFNFSFEPSFTLWATAVRCCRGHGCPAYKDAGCCYSGLCMCWHRDESTVKNCPPPPLQFQCFLGSHALGGSRIPGAAALACRSLIVLHFPTLKLGVGWGVARERTCCPGGLNLQI